MTPMQRWSSKRIAGLRTGADRAATLVEYALVLSLLVVGSLAVFENLTGAADAEIQNQAECVSDRPPPSDDCGFAPVPPDVVTPDPDVTPLPIGPPGQEHDVYTVTAGPTAAEDEPWTLILPVQVFFQTTEPPTEPEGSEGILVRARIQMEDPNNPGTPLPDPGFTDCITEDDGSCDLVFTVPFHDVELATMRITGVDSPNPPDELPPLYSFSRS